MTLISFFAAALTMTWIGMANRTYGILKFLAGVLWFAVLVLWLNGLRPTMITVGSPADTIVVLFLIGIGLSVMLMPWWYDKDKSGKETRGSFQFNGEDEEPEEPRFAPTRQERITGYAQRVNGALKGNRERKRY